MAVKQVVERGYSVAEVAERLSICTKMLYHRKAEQHGSTQQIKPSMIKQKSFTLKAELVRVTEERDILKKSAVGSTGHSDTYPKRLICVG